LNSREHVTPENETNLEELRNTLLKTGLAKISLAKDPASAQSDLTVLGDDAVAADGLDEAQAAETPLELPEEELPEERDEQMGDQSGPPNPLEITVDDPSGDDNFTPEDLQDNIEKIENDPTALIQLPPLHDRCHCVIETLPILSMPGVKDGKRVWQKSDNCCPKCHETALGFNEAEVQRLLNKGIDINRIPR
jgi:hypothetical protein